MVIVLVYRSSVIRYIALLDIFLGTPLGNPKLIHESDSGFGAGI